MAVTIWDWTCHNGEWIWNEWNDNDEKISVNKIKKRQAGGIIHRENGRRANFKKKIKIDRKTF